MPGLPVPPSYWDDTVSTFLDASAERFAADGLPLPELRRAAIAVSGWDEWWPHWMGRADHFEAEANEATLSDLTRSSLLVTAMLCAHIAQYLHFHDPAERASGLVRKVSLYRQAGTYMEAELRSIEIPFRGGSLPAVLRLPNSVETNLPCVIYVGGLDAHKEDAHAFTELCLARGMATLAYDGPGQGEALLRGAELEPGAHTAISAAIDMLEGVAGIGRIGVIGRSLGGYLAPRAAADDSRVEAMVVWAAMYDLQVYDRFPSHTRRGFTFITGADGPEEAKRRTAFIDLTGHAERIECPTLIVHGELDALTPTDHALRLAEEIGDRCELVLVPNSPHCNHDVAHIMRPRMADWLAARLTG